MFPCVCSLRSTQCAALIALATVAGISRFEPAHDSRVTPERPVAVQRKIVERKASFSAQVYPVSMHSLAALVYAPQADFRLDHKNEGGGGAGIGMAAELTETLAPGPRVFEAVANYFGSPVVKPTARGHSYPYAVGPPRCGIHSNLRAVGTEVPDDSPARRWQDLRIVTVSTLTGCAPRRRTTDSGPTLAGSPFSPSCALRGEPGIEQRPARCT